jgi:hypothetical protein
VALVRNRAPAAPSSVTTIGVTGPSCRCCVDAAVIAWTISTSRLTDIPPGNAFAAKFVVVTFPDSAFTT